MTFSIDLNKTPEQNINDIYSSMKKNKAKIEKIKEVISDYEKRLKEQNESEQKKKEVELSKIKTTKLNEWFTKFHWFISSEGYLVVGGRDATTNELVLKKYTDNNDVVFHTMMPGSPFFVMKKSHIDVKSALLNAVMKKLSQGKNKGEKTLSETAIATSSYSKAWLSGFSSSEVFHVNPDQVSKTPESGEYLAKGAFVIRGKKNMMTAKLELAIGIVHDEENSEIIIVSAPSDAIKAYSDLSVTISLGKEDKKSDMAKKIKRQLEFQFEKKTGKKLDIDVNEIISVLPNGGMSVKNS